MRECTLSTGAVLILLVGVLACGGDGGSPSGPSAPSVTTQSISVTLSSPIPVGGTAQASAVATMSNGTTQPIASGFKSDIPSVATVTDSGMVTAVSAGAANIYVVSGGQQGTKNIRVVPNFAGNWSGSYYVTGCSHTGAFALLNFCENFSTNKVFPYNMGLTQPLDTVSGTFAMGTLQFGQSSGTIDGSGQVALNGTYYSGTLTIDARWTLTCPAAGRLGGTVQHVWRDSTVSGQMVVTGAIRDSMKGLGASPAIGDLQDLVRRWQTIPR